MLDLMEEAMLGTEELGWQTLTELRESSATFVDTMVADTGYMLEMADIEDNIIVSMSVVPMIELNLFF